MSLFRAAEDWARVEVRDAGTGSWNTPPDDDMDAEFGRGLAIIDALADKFGHDFGPDGLAVWAEVTWAVD